MWSYLNFRQLILLAFCIAFCNFSTLIAQNGEASFKKICSACHTIGKGKLIGPDLKDVSKRRDAIWLSSFIKSSQDMIKSKDPAAVALFEEYNKIPMPDAGLSDSEIMQVIGYIDEQSLAKSDTPKVVAETVEVVSGDLETGRKLFTGEQQLKNGGVACISCHNVGHSDVDYGGKMAKDLSESYKVLKSAGIKSVLSFLSFPAMENTYKERKLTDAEISDLTAFLKHVSNNRNKSVESFNLMFFLYGMIFFVLLLFFLHTFWKNKKPDSVKEHIYNR